MADNQPDTLPPAWEDRNVGTPADTTRMFANWSGGAIFDYGQPNPRDYDDMLKDGKAKSVEQALTLPLRSADWTFAAANGDRGERDWIDEALTRPANAGGMTTPLNLVLDQMTAGCTYRRVYFEKEFIVRDDGKVSYGQLGWRPPATCQILRTNDGTFNGFKQWRRDLNGANADWVTIEAGRSFVYIHGSYRDPISGISDMDHAYTAWATKQKIAFLWLQYLENQSQNKLIGTHNTQGDDPGKIRFAKQLASLKSGGAIAVDPNQSVMQITPSPSAAFTDAIAYFDRQIVDGSLASFLNLTGVTAGSFALSKNQTDLFLQSRQAVLTEMGTAFTAWVIADLVRFNFGPQAAVPTLEFSQLANEDADRLLTLMTSLVASPGVQAQLPVEFVDEMVVKVAGLLDLSVAKVAAAVEAARAKAEAAGGDLLVQGAAQVDKAHQLVTSAPETSSLTGTAGAATLLK